MSTTCSPADRKLIEALHRVNRGTVGELCREMGVTPTAVRQRLARLEASGLVERHPVRAGRGRPQYDYRVTRAGLRLLGDNYEELALLLWRAMNRIDDGEVRERIVAELREAFVERIAGGVTAATPGERFRQLRDVLHERGFDVELQDTAVGRRLPILREHNCPYYEISSHDPAICELERSVFADVVGAPVELTACCRDGQACCEFELSSGSGCDS